MNKALPWVMLVVGLIGFFITFPLWFMNKISDRQMLGLTLTLSWAALWYEAYNAIRISKEK